MLRVPLNAQAILGRTQECCRQQPAEERWRLLPCAQQRRHASARRLGAQAVSTPRVPCEYRGYPASTCLISDADTHSLNGREGQVAPKRSPCFRMSLFVCAALHSERHTRWPVVQKPSSPSKRPADASCRVVELRCGECAGAQPQPHAAEPSLGLRTILRPHRGARCLCRPSRSPRRAPPGSVRSAGASPAGARSLRFGR